MCRQELWWAHVYHQNGRMSTVEVQTSQQLQLKMIHCSCNRMWVCAWRHGVKPNPNGEDATCLSTYLHPACLPTFTLRVYLFGCVYQFGWGGGQGLHLISNSKLAF